MELRSVDVLRDTGDPGRVRVVGRVAYDDAADVEDLWFDVPERHAATLSRSGDAWLVALLPLAARLGEPLRMGLPIDARLARGAREVMRIWSVWHEGLRVAQPGGTVDRILQPQSNAAFTARTSGKRSSAFATAAPCCCQILFLAALRAAWRRIAWRRP